MEKFNDNRRPGPAAPRRARRNPLADDKAVPRLKNAKRYGAELKMLYKEHGSLNPAVVIEYARTHPESALYGRFTWDDTKAAHEYRLWQARQLIGDFKIVRADPRDGSDRNVRMFISPVEQRGDGGYSSLTEVLDDEQRRSRFIDQALVEYQSIGEKYIDLTELSEIRDAVDRAVAVRKK